MQTIVSYMFVLFLVLGNVAVLRAADQPLDTVVASVNDVKILEAELVQEVGRTLPMNAGFHGNITTEKMDKFRSDALKKLVELELQFQEGRSLGMKLTEAELKGAIETVAKKFSTREEYLEGLKGAGFDEARMNHFLDRQLLASRVVKAMVDDKVKVDDAMVKASYDKNPGRYSKPEEYRASHILVKVDPASTAEEKKERRVRAEELLKKVRGGGNFADIAAKESDDLSRIKGGDLGNFHAGQTLPEFEDVLKAMKPGDISDIVETMYGFHIVKLTDRKPPRQIPFDEIKGKIRDDLVKAERKRIFEEWMSALKAKSRITISGSKITF